MSDTTLSNAPTADSTGPADAAATTPGEPDHADLSPSRLMWLRFKRHRLALISMGFLGVMYTVALVAEFVAPYTPEERNVRAIFAPPQSIHFFDQLSVMRTLLIQPEDGWRPRGASSTDRELDPVFDRIVLGLTHPPDIAFLNCVFN